MGDARGGGIRNGRAAGLCRGRSGTRLPHCSALEKSASRNKKLGYFDMPCTKAGESGVVDVRTAPDGLAQTIHTYRVQ
jgi:hypothetical protein